MGEPSSSPTQVLIDGVRGDLGGLWSLLYAAELTALRVSSEQDRLDAGAVNAAISLRQAVEELEWSHPDLGAGAAAVDLDPTDADGTRSAAGDLLTAALGIAPTLLDDPDLAVEDVLMLARVVGLIADAHRHLTGRLP